MENKKSRAKREVHYLSAHMPMDGRKIKSLSASCVDANRAPHYTDYTNWTDQTGYNNSNYTDCNGYSNLNDYSD